ncbi:MAG: hypothetical protein JWM68_1089 [Verrucomicrobiales bacterium]|nr:hypothetical protein [Verrucomicrobiales bacterium]
MKALALILAGVAATFFIPNLPAAERILSPQEVAQKQEWERAIKQQREKELALVSELRRVIVAGSRETSEAEMKLYSNAVHAIDRNTRYVNPAARNKPVDFSYVMVPIPGGEFTMGSPENEVGRRADEGPQRKVKVSPFWMEQCEVTWAEYEPFMLNMEEPYPKDTNRVGDASDAVAKPTKPYDELSFGMGKNGCPALAMTQHGANKYCEWLSAKTGHFYRLPTEAEWEYACRAGTTTAYSFGNNPTNLSDYAWFEDNSDRKYHKVGKKKPNPWGLYDMHGNVAEWCLDQYDPNFYAQGKAASANPWNKATQPYPHVIRGGAWRAFGETEKSDANGEFQLRSAAREKSDKVWKTDPNLPPSIWYLDKAQFVGFRIIRPLKIPTADEMFHYWNSGVENEGPPRW